MFAWATPKYLLEYMTLDEVIFYYDTGMEMEEVRASLIIQKLGEALEDPKEKKPSPGQSNDKPDKEAFYKRHGDKIKRPNKGGDE